MRARTPRRPPADRHAPAPDPAERLHKVLAQAGIASRRTIEGWIAAGRVAVNGVPAVAGQRVHARDSIAIDGRPVRRPTAAAARTRVIVLNKPEGAVCTRRDAQGRPSVFELLPELRPGRWISIGRLDVATTGLLLFTDDGELAHRLMHPRYEIPREYAVRVLGEVDRALLDRLLEGVEIDGERLAFDRIEARPGAGANQWFICTLHTGRNREVRRLWESQGVRVSRLIRTRFGPIGMPPGLRRGRARALEPAAIDELRRLVGLARPPARARAQIDLRRRGR